MSRCDLCKLPVLTIFDSVALFSRQMSVPNGNSLLYDALSKRTERGAAASGLLALWSERALWVSSVISLFSEQIPR